MQDSTNPALAFSECFKYINHALCIVDQDLTPILATNYFYRAVDQLPSKELTLIAPVLDGIKFLLSTCSRSQQSPISQTPLHTKISISNKTFEIKNYFLTLMAFSPSIPSDELNLQKYLIELIPIDPILFAARSFNSYKEVISRLTHELFHGINKATFSKHTNLASAVTAAISIYDNLMPSNLEFSNRIKESLLLRCSTSRMQELLFRIILEAADFTSANGHIVFDLNHKLLQKKHNVEIYTFATRNKALQLDIDGSIKFFMDNIGSYATKVFQNEIFGNSYITMGNKLINISQKEETALHPGSFEVQGFDTLSLNIKELQKIIVNSSEAVHIQMARSDLLVIRLSVPMVNALKNN